MPPRVSIVLPTYNQAQYLPSALDSIFAQSSSNFELIVVNDGSTDSTASVLARYQEQHDFTLIEQENRGLPGALNAGFRRVSGEYLTWTSSDNLMMPRMLERLTAILDEEPEVGLVYADWYVIDEQDQVLALARTLEPDRHLLMRLNYVYACFMYRRQCQDQVGLYNPELRYAEDWDYWLRIAQHFPMAHVSEPLYMYRVHGSSLTSELKQGTGERYRAFADHWRTRQPAAWHYSRLKWHWRKLRTGSAPAVRLEPVSSFEDPHQELVQ